MTPKATTHVIQGMQKDTSKSKLSKEFAFDAKNIRITAREDNSLLSITNEKGTEYKFTLDGKYLGHCILNNQLVLFTKKGEIDTILVYNSYFNKKILYEGDLNFNLNNHIEALGVYENEDIQKVYWVDGLNQPRVINIKASGETIKKWTNTSFDFVPELALQESVSVEAVSTSSMFAPGVIQYTFSYYNKYGQESNIFDVTPLCYIAHKERGASPEEVIKDLAFKIRVDNVDTNFEYIRIYSIHRTSLDATPTVKRVIDLPILIPEKTSGVKDYKYSYFLGSINNAYLRLKDGYDLENREPSFHNKTLDEVSTIIKEKEEGSIKTTTYQFNNLNSIESGIINKYNIVIASRNEDGTINPDSIEKTIEGITWNALKFVVNDGPHGITYGISLYDIENSQSIQGVSPFLITYTVENNTDNISVEYIDNGTLGETIDPTQLLYIGGENIIAGSLAQKDNTLFLGNIQLTKQLISEELKEAIKNATISPVEKIITYKNNYSQFGIYTNENSYYKPREHYRLGIQFQYKNGKWLEPLYISDYTISSITSPSDKRLPSIGVVFPQEVKTFLNNHKDLKKFRPLVVFPDSADKKIIAQGILCPTLFNAEDRLDNNPYAQSSWFLRPNIHNGYDEQNAFDNSSTSYVNQGSIVEFRHDKPLTTGADRGAEIQNGIEYKVDQSILNFYSPELEFGNISSIEDGVKMRIVGIAQFDYNYGDIDIQTSTPTYKPTALGFKKYQVNRTIGGERSLISGLFYKDSDMTTTNKLPDTMFLIYPWHRSGSLNNDTASSAASEDRIQSSILKKKRISNIKISNETRYFSKSQIWEASGENDYTSFSNGISKVTLCNSNYQTIVKIKEDDNNILNYFPNVNALLNNDTSIVIGKVKEDGINSELESQLGTQSAPVRLTYKTSPHCVFKLNKSSNNKQVILPSIDTINNINNTETSTPVIINKDEILGEEIKFKQSSIPNSASIGDLWIDTSRKARIKSGESGTIIIMQKISSNKGGYNDWVRYYPEGNYSYCHYYKTPTTVEIFKGLIIDSIMVSKLWIKHKTINIKIESSNSITIIQDDLAITMPSQTNKPPIAYLYMAELYRDEDFVTNAFGGISDDAIKNNLWLPASKSIVLNDNSINFGFTYDYGDTYYQRYDCLKTYAFTPEDENQVIEIASFMCETRVNMLGRYDKNIGNLSNLNADPTNFNLFNPVYSQRDNFFNYRILDSDLYKLDKFPTSITWSKEKHPGEDVDTWTNITMANTLDLDGTKGKLNKLVISNNKILAFQDKGIAEILFNSRVQIPVSDGVPVEISNGYKVDGSRYISAELGCQNKYSIQVTPSGIYFLDSESSGIYLLGNEGLTNLSTNKGFDVWTKEVANDSTFKTFYDKNNKDVYFITKDYCLGYSEKLEQFTSFYDYNGVEVMFNSGKNFYSIKTGNRDTQHLYQHFTGDYNNFYGETKPYYITLISNEDPQINKIFTNLEYRADFYKDNHYLVDESFDSLEVWNEYQYNKIPLIYSKYRPSSLKKKFRTWKIDIPRDKYHKLDRMKNPWLFIKIAKEEPENYKMELHDIIVKYFE